MDRGEIFGTLELEQSSREKYTLGWWSIRLLCCLNLRRLLRVLWLQTSA